MEQTTTEQREKTDTACLEDYNRSGTMGDQPQNSVRFPGWLSLAQDRLAKASRVSPRASSVAAAVRTSRAGDHQRAWGN